MRRLGLQSPIYKRTAAYGHFGRTPTVEKYDSREIEFFPWEKTDRIDELNTAIGA
jgi:S-adenosylmethionine synthetase